MKDQTRSSSFAWILLFLLGLVIFTIGIRLSLAGNTIGADFYTFWLAGRVAIIDGQNPYSPVVTLQSQLGILGRAANPVENQLAFAYPIYSLFALIPEVCFPFDWAQAFWLAFNLMLLITILIFAWGVDKPFLSLSFLLFYPIFLGLVLGNFSILVACIAMVWVAFIFTQPSPSRFWQAVAGGLLAWATIKPQFIWPILLVAFLDSLRRKLHIFWGGFVGGWILCLAISFLIFPGWLEQWIYRVVQYAKYSRGKPVIIQQLEVILPQQAADWLGFGILGLLAIAIGWILWAWWRGRFNQLLTLGWCGIFGFLVHPVGSAHEQLIFLIPLLASMAANGWPKRQRVFWWVAILFSWGAFFLAKSGIPAIDQWGVFLFTGWWLWQGYLIQKKPKAKTWVLQHQNRG